jgi:hypothetical protein
MLGFQERVTMKRIKIKLTTVEEDAFNVLHRHPFASDIWAFWRKVAAERGLDHGSIMQLNGTVTALPTGHGLEWCHPMPLKCKSRPEI